MSAFGIFAIILTTAYIIYFAVIIAKDLIANRQTGGSDAPEIFDLDFQQEESVTVTETTSGFSVGDVEIQTENAIIGEADVEPLKSAGIADKISEDLSDTEAEAIYEMSIIDEDFNYALQDSRNGISNLIKRRLVVADDTSNADEARDIY